MSYHLYKFSKHNTVLNIATDGKSEVQWSNRISGMWK